MGNKSSMSEKTRQRLHAEGRAGFDEGKESFQCPKSYQYTEKEKVWAGGWWHRFWEVNGTDLGPPESWGYKKPIAD